MPHPAKTPYMVDVYDLLHRPGEMRERTLEITVPDDLGTDIIAVKTGSVLTVDLRMESLHDGILLSADVTGTASGECVRCLIASNCPSKSKSKSFSRILKTKLSTTRFRLTR